MTTLAERLYLRDSFGMTGLGISLTIATALAAAIAIMLVLIIGLGRHYGRISCRTFSAQTGRPTKFVIYNTFDTGDCLTPTTGGKWIPTKNLREFGEGR